MAKARLAFERTALHELLAEDEIGTPVLAAFDKLRDVYLKGDGLCSPAELERRGDEVTLVKQLAPLLDGQVALALDAEMAAGAHTPRFLLVASMSSEDRQRELTMVMEKHRYSQTTNPHSQDFNSQVGAYEVCRIENTDLGLYEAWAFVENLFIYGQGKRIVEDAVERYSAKNSAGSLALHGGYQNAYREVGRDEQGRDALLYLQVDAAALIKNIINLMPGNELLKTRRRSRGVAEAQRPHLAVGLTVSDGGHAAIKEKSFSRLLAKDKLPAPGAEALKAVTARFAQNDTLFFLATQSKLMEALYPHFKRLADPEKEECAEEIGGDAQRRNGIFRLLRPAAGREVRYPGTAGNFPVRGRLMELDRDLNEVEFNELHGENRSLHQADVCGHASGQCHHALSERGRAARRKRGPRRRPAYGAAA